MYTPESLISFTKKVNRLRFPVTMYDAYKILVLTENCDLPDVFEDLSLMRTDVKIYCNPNFKIGGRAILSNKEKSRQMSQFGMSSYPYVKQIDKMHKNALIDLTEFGKEIRTRLKGVFNSPRSAMFFSSGLASFASDKTFKNILLYVIDLRKPFDVATNRRLGWIPIYHSLSHKENIPYIDSMIMCVITATGSPAFIKVYDKREQIQFTRSASILKSVKVTDMNLETFGEEVISSVAIQDEVKNVSADSKSKDLIRVPEEKADSAIKEAIAYVAVNHPEEASDLIKELNSASTSDDKDLIKKAIILGALKYKINGNKDSFNKTIENANNVIASKPSKEQYKQIKDETILEIGKYVERSATDFKITNLSVDQITKHINIKNVVDKKLPTAIIENKQSSFNLSLFNDLVKVLKTFSKKEFPLTLTKYKIETKHDKSDIKASKFVVFKFTMKDDKGKEYNNEILLPHLDKQGNMVINGIEKILVGQLMLKPIFFSEPHICKIITFFSTMQMQYRAIRDKAYTIAYITGMVVPLYLVFSLLFKRGLDDLFAKLGYSRKDIVITRNPEETKLAKKDNPKWFIQFHNNEYAFFPAKIMESNELAKTFFYSMKLINYSARKITVDQFFDNGYQNEMLIINTGRKNASHNIKSFFNGFLDPISLELIEEQGYPTKLEDLLWKCTELIHTEKVDKRTDLGVQRYRTTETFLHIIYKQLLMSYEVYQNKKLMGYTESSFELKPDYVFKEVVNTQLIRGNENINPIEELSAATRMTYVGVGGVMNKEGVPERMRVVDESYFGTIDAIDTPEGGSNIGLLQHATVDALLKNNRGSFDVKKVNNEEKTGISSVSSVMTPFGNHDDGARSMMAANQIRQAVPLVNKEVPIVQTGYETALSTFLSNSFVKKSSFDGIVKEVSDKQIVLESTEDGSKGKKQIIDLMPMKLNSGMTMHSISYFEPKVKVGDKVKKHHLLAEGSSIKDGTISLGTNLLVAFLPYHGANHDDSIIISKEVASYVTSRHIETIQIHIMPDSKIIEAPGVREDGTRVDVIQRMSKYGDGIEYEKGDVILSYIPDNLAKFVELNPHETIYGGGVVKHKANKNGKLLDVKVYANDDINKYPKLKQLYLASREKHNTNDDSNYKVRGEKFEGVLIDFIFEYMENGVNCGDKYANRHGNKGVVALVDDKMPVTPWGQKVDIIFNPLGVIGRMNPGQLFELYLGLIGWKVKEEMLAKPSQKNAIDVIKKVYYNILDRSKDKMISKTVLHVLSKMSTNQFKDYLEQLKKQKGMPWIFPTYATPKLNDIQKALQVLGLKDKYTLDLPIYGPGVKTKMEVPVGYLYMYKMEHVSSHKIASRGVGAYEKKSRQPTVGRQSKGGQRVGEFDSWSLFSHGATNVIKEMFGALSDDYISKNEMISNIIENGVTHASPEIKVTPTRDILDVYFKLMLLDLKKK